eukprot:TRINITY_DN7775_c0_g1_i4.p1 TRINITY_DN7775_c0_g1~~TRINITY_DN7775_c0_g1_i4.p1  ORF type:complete len:105 (-),score=3.86 TRINITY_DN7775_c0_g1_i4:181-495(-)
MSPSGILNASDLHAADLTHSQGSGLSLPCSLSPLIPEYLAVSHHSFTRLFERGSSSQVSRNSLLRFTNCSAVLFRIFGVCVRRWDVVEVACRKARRSRTGSLDM